MKRALRVTAIIIAWLIATASHESPPPQGSSINSPEVMELFNKGEAFFLKGDYNKAIHAYSKAYERSDNRSAIALYGIGKSHLKLSRFEEARQCGEQILEIADTQVDKAAAMNLIGTALLGMARKDRHKEGRLEMLNQAESHLRGSLDLSSGQFGVTWFNLSVVLEELDRLAEAREAQREYAIRTPGNRTATIRLCQLEYLAGLTTDTPESSTASGSSQSHELSEESEARDLEVELEESPPPSTGGDFHPPTRIYAPMPKYTEFARQARIEGQVRMVVRISKEGRVTDVKLIEGPLPLYAAAVVTVKTWRFEPATRNGKPIAVTNLVSLAFSPGRSRPTPLEASVQISHETHELLEDEKGQRAVRVGGEVQPPIKISASSPQYTETARRAHLQGVVILEAIIGKTGTVSHVKVLQGLPMGLDKAAALAVCQWQFEPTTLDGEPVDVVYNLTVNFRLQ